MRAIHINPWTRTITEIDLDSELNSDGTEGITYPALRAAVFHGKPEGQQGYIERVSVGTNVDAWVDEEGLLIPWEEQRFLCLHPAGRPRDGRDYAGHMILTGSDGWGNSTGLDPRITVDMVKRTVRWIDPREVVVDAPRMTTVDDDGTVKTELLAGCEQWSFENQPT